MLSAGEMEMTVLGCWGWKKKYISCGGLEMEELVV